MKTSCISVQSPCPMVLKRLENADGTFSCSSCNKNLVDFRNSTEEEIKRIATPDTCGIFYNEQIQYSHFSLSYRFKFLLLTVISAIGLNVSPIHAQQAPETTKAKPVLKPAQVQGSKGPVYNERKAIPVQGQRKDVAIIKPYRKKRRYVSMGCPSF